MELTVTCEDEVKINSLINNLTKTITNDVHKKIYSKNESPFESLNRIKKEFSIKSVNL